MLLSLPYSFRLLSLFISLFYVLYHHSSFLSLCKNKLERPISYKFSTFQLLSHNSLFSINKASWKLYLKFHQSHLKPISKVRSSREVKFRLLNSRPLVTKILHFNRHVAEPANETEKKSITVVFNARGVTKKHWWCSNRLFKKKPNVWIGSSNEGMERFESVFKLSKERSCQHPTMVATCSL